MADDRRIEPDVSTSIDSSFGSETEFALRLAQAQLAGILAIAAEAIISFDNEQRIVLFNRGAEQIFGYAKQDVIGQPLELLLPSRFRATHGQHVTAFGRSGTAARCMGERSEIFGLRKDGTEFAAEASISQLDFNGSKTYTIVLRDVSERKAAQQALAQANKELETRVAERTRELSEEMQRREQAQAELAKAQRMEAFGQLTGGIAHDFNNLLTVIAGNQELLEMRLEDAKNLALLKRAQDAAAMGARLTSRLLTFARRRQLEPELIDLNDQIIGMVELLRRSIGEDIIVTTNLSPHLWKVKADASEVENGLLNLALNARDAMPSGGTIVIETADCSVDADGAIDLTKLAPGDYVRVSVSDTGTGMAPEVLNRAFEPFFTTKGPGKGTGLGLSTIYGFVQQSGGTVTAYSEVGRGTTINMYLPRAPGEIGAATPMPDADLPIPMGHGERILVVEDDPDVRDLTVRRLKGLAYEVLETETGVAAVAMLERGSGDIDLVFSDVVMPGGVSGYDVARWISENAPQVGVLLSSGYPDEVARRQPGALPDVKLLRKPYNRAELAHAIRSAIGRRR